MYFFFRYLIRDHSGIRRRHFPADQEEIQGLERKARKPAKNWESIRGSTHQQMGPSSDGNKNSQIMIHQAKLTHV